jgi:hypothetical protein
VLPSQWFRSLCGLLVRVSPGRVIVTLMTRLW